MWGLVFALTFVIARDELKSLRCGDFAVQGDAQFFMFFGASQLDGNDHDGRACENLSTPRAGTLHI